MKFFSNLFISAIFVASAYTNAKTADKTEIKSNKIKPTVKPEASLDVDNENDVVFRQNNQCYITQFKCTNGQCIKKSVICDGYADCSDGSDESNSLCYNPNNYPTTTTKRPSLYPLSNNNEIKSTTMKNAKSACKLGEFYCTSNECIPQVLTCNGIKDCNDGSDEAKTICPKYPTTNSNNGNKPLSNDNNNNNNGNQQNINRCLSTQFRCDNGECIFGGYRCDGKLDCQDGSDEMWIMCQKADLPTSRPQRPTIRPNIGSDDSDNWQKKLTPCRVPNQPANGRWRLHRSLCDSGRECNPPAGMYTMNAGTYLVYNCDEGYTLNGTRDVLCGPGGKWIHEPKCDEIKCKDLSSSTTEAICLWNNVAVSCEIPAPIGTTARLNCRQGFVQEITYTLSYKNVTCEYDGKWNPRPIKCVKKPKKVKLVLEGDMIIEE